MTAQQTAETIIRDSIKDGVQLDGEHFLDFLLRKDFKRITINENKDI